MALNRLSILVLVVTLAGCGTRSEPPGKEIDADAAAGPAPEAGEGDVVESDPVTAPGDCGVPAAPTGLRGQPGPGPTMASLTWDAADANGGREVIRYRVFRDGEPYTRLGNTLAYGDTGATGSHDYAIAAINDCDREGPRSEVIGVTALPGALVEAPVSPSQQAIHSVHSYRVVDAAGQDVGTRRWRTIRGLGNCCETYVATDARGRLYEYGGSSIYFSDDVGQSWSTVSNVTPTVGAEGAIVGAPGGDMLAVNWDPYTGDQVWAHKYHAASDTWYTSRTPLHQPFYDRPYIAVVEGPFEIEGVLVPYVSFVLSNFHGRVLLMSLDGLNYEAPSTKDSTEGVSGLPAALPRDPSRDWIQAMRETGIFPFDDGFGLGDRGVPGDCGQAVLTPAAQWACPDWGEGTLSPSGDEVVRVDSMGSIHVTRATVGLGILSHRISRDGGRTWAQENWALPNRHVVENWDVQVNAALDQVVVVVHAAPSLEEMEHDQDMVYRFRGLQDNFRLDEVLLVGNGDHPFGGGLGASSDRFDYTTVALLPSGKVVLSFGDRRHTPPAVAIELD